MTEIQPPQFPLPTEEYETCEHDCDHEICPCDCVPFKPSGKEYCEHCCECLKEQDIIICGGCYQQVATFNLKLNNDGVIYWIAYCPDCKNGTETNMILALLPLEENALSEILADYTE